MAAIIVPTGTQCVWGTSTTSSMGVVINGTVNKQAQTAPVPDNEGARTGMVIYDEVYSGSITVNISSSSTSAPTIGSAITVMGVSGYVTGVSLTEANNDLKKATISFEGGAHFGDDDD